MCITILPDQGDGSFSFFGQQHDFLVFHFHQELPDIDMSSTIRWSSAFKAKAGKYSDFGPGMATTGALSRMLDGVKPHMRRILQDSFAAAVRLCPTIAMFSLALQASNSVRRECM